MRTVNLTLIGTLLLSLNASPALAQDAAPERAASAQPTAPAHPARALTMAKCFQCHTDLQPQFSMPFHHKVNEGLVKCSDCHDPHGTMQGKMLRTTASQNAICTKCHTEKAGPFVYEHPVVKVDLAAILKCYQARYPGAMYSGCGGGYLYVVSEEAVPGSLHVKIRMAKE